MLNLTLPFYRSRLVLGATLGLVLAVIFPVMAEKMVAAEGGWHEAVYQETGQDIANPERGLYVQFTAREDAVPLDVDALRKLREKNITLTLRLYYLKEFRDRPIAKSRLKLIHDDMQKLREVGVKCILRFAYNESIGEPDAPIEVVLKHMEQLTPIFKRNADVIAVVQAGFVGSWGEWHASTNNLREPKNAKRIISAWLNALPAGRFVQVRTPTIKAMLVDGMNPLEPEEAWSGSPRSRIAHHNDCFLATVNDMGTYEDIDVEKRYLDQETVTLPMGGETCHVSEFIEIDHARSELSRFHWSYLHQDYHPDVIKAWKKAGFLEEIQRKLGYRLVLERAAVSEQIVDGRLGVKLVIRNVGWAAPFNPRTLELILKSPRREVVLPIDSDPRAWVPGERIEVRQNLALPADTPEGEYQVWLGLPDPEASLNGRPEYAIRLANEGLWEAATGRHDLGLRVHVSGGGRN